MPTRATEAAAKQEMRFEEFYATRVWISLSGKFPEPGRHVLLKMADGRVESGHWDSALARWTRSPFEKGGIPVAWAPLPELRKSS